MKTKRVLAIFSALVMAVMSICGSAVTAAADEGGGEVKGEIAMLPPGMVSPYYAQMIYGEGGAVEKAESLGYTLTVLAPETESDFDQQCQIMEDVISKGVDAIALSAINGDALVPAVKKANEAGIPVIIFTTLYELSGGDIFAYVGYDNWAGGKMVGDYLVDISGDSEKNIAVIEGLPSAFTDERGGGFLEAIEGKENMHVIATQPGDWVRDKSMDVATNLLQAHPEINVFYCMSDEMSLGCAQACKQLGLKVGEDGILICGIDGNENAIEAVKAGEITSTLDVMPSQIGANAVETCVKALNGEECEKKVVSNTKIIDASNCDEYLKD